MKKIVFLFVLFISVSASAQQNQNTTVKYEGELIKVTIPEKGVFSFFLLRYKPEADSVQTRLALFGENGIEQQNYDLATNMYFRNGKVLFKVGNFKVVSRPVTTREADYLLQTYHYIEQ